tara:strand:+ start:2030 stop:2728 length:699 start_codon:yes stop_codon:yes gene_type:complete
VSYSFYEIYITAQRAFTAMGFPYGSDEDAAFIIAWLELNDFQGINLLASLVDQLDQKYEGGIKLNDLNKTIDFKNKSILMKGAGLIDFMSSEMKNNNKISVKIINCSNEIFFLPLLYKKTKYIKSSKLIFYDKNNINTYIIMDYKIIFYQEKNNNLKFQNIVNIVMDKNKQNFQYPAMNQLISETEIQKNLSKSLSPKKNSWDIISKIANKTFVPESDESRNKGAGGGDDND